ncbi:MAG TPA: ABC transporter substrate-binding protein [Xanthobacteraceae bacterium]|jgi:polar amino acid transport system substrate-binding protein|nr:ABC transporter substrate-binding protein [Xanthobacteraceae bacterium]
MPAAPEKAVEDIAPTGRLRASINLGNIVLAQTDPKTGQPAGVTVELAKSLGERLGVPVDLITFDAAGKAFDAFKRGATDIVFLAIDPVRAEEIAFTPPYALIEGNFMVRADSAFKSIADIDREGVRVAVAKGSAYDLFLTRALKSATLVRASTGPEAMDMFLSADLDAAAGVRQPIVKFMSEHAGLRLIEPSFMEIRQAMGMGKGRPAGSAYLHSFIEEMKASGLVAAALKRSGQDDVVVAPPIPA